MSIREEAKVLRKLWGGFWASRVLLTANNLGVFDHLKSPGTARAVAGKLKTDVRASEILLDALTGMGLLEKSSGKYKNSATANRFLVKDAHYYQGDIMRHADNLWENWSGLDQVIKTGRPNHKAHNHEAFIRGMHNLAVLKAKDVIGALDLRGVEKSLDVGGGPGTYSIELARRGVSATLFDVRETIKTAREVVRESGVSGIEFLEGDFLSDEITGKYDLIFISQVIHAYSNTDNLRLLKKAGRTLNPGGRIAIQEFYLDKGRAFPPQGALFSVNMLVNTDAGRCYSPAEIGGWLLKAGFRSVAKKMLDDTVLITARK